MSATQPRTTRRRGGKVCPVRCPHCGEALPPCLPSHVLEAIRAIAALPGGEGTALDVVAAGVTARRTRAAELLRMAGAAGVAHAAGWVVTAGRQRAKRWRVDPAVAACYGRDGDSGKVA